MNCLALMAKLHRLGVELSPVGDRLRYLAPRGVLIEELQGELAECKEEILDCLLSAERFGQAHAAMFPLIGKRVETPDGPGLLVQVFQCCARVVLEGSDHSTDYAPEILLGASAHAQLHSGYSETRKD